MSYTKESLERVLAAAGDATVDYVNSAGARRYMVVTTDFDNKYIKSKLSERKRAFDETGIVVFAWDIDKFKTIDPATVVGITPMSSTLKNV